MLSFYVLCRGVFVYTPQVTFRGSIDFRYILRHVQYKYFPFAIHCWKLKQCHEVRDASIVFYRSAENFTNTSVPGLCFADTAETICNFSVSELWHFGSYQSRKRQETHAEIGRQHLIWAWHGWQSSIWGGFMGDSVQFERWYQGKLNWMVLE